MNDPEKSDFELRPEEKIPGVGANVRLGQAGERYRSAQTRLPLYGWHHLVMIAKKPGFVTNVCVESLWQQIAGPRFTTPLKREWAPWLFGQIVDNYSMFSRARGTGCECGVLRMTIEQLDALVTSGITNKHLEV